MSARPQVLVVDDEPANRKLLADLVRREGLEVVLASDGAEALAVIARESVDLVLLDVMMPRVDGMAVLAELQRQERLPSLPVVVVTAHEDRKVRIEALMAGAIDFVTKPIDRLEVTCKVRTLIELGRLRASAREQAARQATLELHERVHGTIRGLPLFLYRGRSSAPGHLALEWVLGDVERVAGLSPEEARAHENWLDRVHPDDREEIACAFAGSGAEGPTSWRSRYRLRHPSRGDVWVLDVGHLDRGQGVLTGATLDVSVEKSLEEALLQSRKMDAMGHLAGGVAHDFNNILAVILAYGSIVRDQLPEGDERRNDIVEVLKAGERGAGLTRQLLAFSRQQPTEKKPIDLNESLAQLHRLLTRTLGEHLELRVAPAGRPAVVRIDPVQFDQIVLNLAVNARDAMPDGGKLHLALRHLPPPSGGEVARVQLEVTDTGTGMDEQTQLRIFEPFFTTKAKGQGTGLGLATCFGIVADVGGAIRVRSAPGRGTTFTVELPVCGEEAHPLVSSSLPVAHEGRGETVLVAEDDAVLRKVSARILASAGYTVHVASDGHEALRRVDELGSSLDVLVSDVVMPGPSGHDVAEHVRRIAPRAAVLLTSGFLDEASRRNHRIDRPILWKPVPPRDLVRAVGEALEARRAKEKKSPQPAARGLVLIVEDDDAAGRAMGRLLVRAGYSSRIATTLAAARRVLDSEPEPHVVLCDLSLPDGSGAELLEWIQATRPGLCPRVFVLTGGVTDSAGQKVTESRSFKVLSKPIRLGHLLEVLAGIPAAKG